MWRSLLKWTFYMILVAFVALAVISLFVLITTGAGRPVPGERESRRLTTVETMATAAAAAMGFREGFLFLRPKGGLAGSISSRASSVLDRKTALTRTTVSPATATALSAAEEKTYI